MRIERDFRKLALATQAELRRIGVAMVYGPVKRGSKRPRQWA
jgi:hypothetical protein